MVAIAARGTRSIDVPAPLSAIFALIEDVPRSGGFFPGVDRIEPVGPGEFRWVLAERKTLGARFVGDYTTRYTFAAPREASWVTLGGNVRSTGRWTVAGEDGRARVTLEITSEVEVALPSLMRKPAELFASREIESGLETQLERFRRALL